MTVPFPRSRRTTRHQRRSEYREPRDIPQDSDETFAGRRRSASPSYGSGSETEDSCESSAEDLYGHMPEGFGGAAPGNTHGVDESS